MTERLITTLLPGDPNAVGVSDRLDVLQHHGIPGRRPGHDACGPVVAVKVFGAARSRQLGRANPPTTRRGRRGPTAGTGVAPSNASTFITASWWQSSQVTDSERMLFALMLARVMGGPR
jgi:hypothetical protein